MISHYDSKQHQHSLDARLTRTVSTPRVAARRPLVTWLLLLGLLAVSLAIAAPSAFAEDGLPSGVPVPAWAVGKHVHFYPPPSQRTSVVASEEALSPQLAGPAVTEVCPKGGKLCYWGGPVQHEPQLFVIFWGAGFQKGPPGGLELTDLRDFYLGLEENKGERGEKAWQGTISQYFDNEGPGSRKAKVAAIWMDTSSPGELTNAKVESTITELVNNEREKGVNPSAEAQYIVLPQPGTSYKKYTQMNNNCGFHGVDGEGYSYSLVAYAGDVGCEGGEGALAETSGTAAHEFAEGATDPGIEEPGKNYTSRTGWAKEEAGSIEVADLCEEFPAEKPKNDFWWAVKLWDDEGGNKCNLEDPPYPPPPVPSATTEGATGITTTEATVAGSLNPNGPDAHYYFEYGTTTSYGTKIPTPPGNNAGFGEAAVPVSVKITGLKAGTLYHYRLVASSWVGTTDGVDQTFRTAGWTIQTTQNPHGSDETDEFTGVSCWAANGCDAVGLNANPEYEIVGLVERWNGTAWEVQSTPKSTGASEDNLEAVSCRSASECEATGYAEVAGGKHITLAEGWNGTAWSVQSTPTTKGENSNLVSVSCGSASECVASGFSQPSIGIYAPLAELWNGKEWKILTTATLPKEDEQPRFGSISCPKRQRLHRSRRLLQHADG